MQFGRCIVCKIQAFQWFRNVITGRIGAASIMTGQHNVFITGGTGYMGQRLIATLLQRGHRVRALVRPGSEKKLPAGCSPVLGNALESSSYAAQIAPADTFV